MPHVTAAKFPVTIGGREYMMSPMTDRDIEEVNNWLRASYIRMARESLTPDMTAEQRAETLAVAMREARGINWYDKSGGGQLMKDLSGVTRVFWQCMQHHDPAPTLEEVGALLRDRAELEAMLEVWKEMNLQNSRPEVGQKGEGQAGRRPARRRSTPSSAES